MSLSQTYSYIDNFSKHHMNTIESIRYKTRRFIQQYIGCDDFYFFCFWKFKSGARQTQLGSKRWAKQILPPLFEGGGGVPLLKKNYYQKYSYWLSLNYYWGKKYYNIIPFFLQISLVNCRTQRKAIKHSLIEN